MNESRRELGDKRGGPQRVAAVFSAHNVQSTIGQTVRACHAIPGVDLIVVVDDGSTDATGRNARLAGAVVVRHSVMRGRASAFDTAVKVVAMRDREDWPPRLLLFLSPDLGDSAVESIALVEAVRSGRASCACGIPNGRAKETAGTWADKSARSAIRSATGWISHAPLVTERCMTRHVISAVMPFANDSGMEVAMSIDLLAAGFSIVELPCGFEHRNISRPHLRARFLSVWAIWRVSLNRHLRRVHLDTRVRRLAARDQQLGSAYPSVSVQDSARKETKEA